MFVNLPFELTESYENLGASCYNYTVWHGFAEQTHRRPPPEVLDGPAE